VVDKRLSREGWNRHEWRERNGRRLRVASGASVLQRHCIRCSREFLIFESSGDRLAVYPSIVSFHQLADDVTARWLKEHCPGKLLPRDEEDRKRRIAEVPVSG